MPWKIVVASQVMLLALAPGPNATLSPTSLTFSTEPIGTRSKDQTVTLKNNGTATLNITKIRIGGKNAVDFAQTHTCGTALSEGASCSINVTFKPSASGTRTATVSVTDNAADSPQMVSLSGTGTAGRCSPEGAQCPPQRPPCKSNSDPSGSRQEGEQGCPRSNYPSGIVCPKLANVNEEAPGPLMIEKFAGFGDLTRLQDRKSSKSDFADHHACGLYGFPSARPDLLRHAEYA